MNKPMESPGGGRFWQDFRQEAVACLARWVGMGYTVSLVGSAGCGKSNLLRYLSLDPTRLGNMEHTPFVILVPLDFRHLVSQQSALLYHLILRSCARWRQQFPQPLATLVEELYGQYRSNNDLIVLQTAVSDLLTAVQNQQGRLVLILDHFDSRTFADAPQIPQLLRGLRDDYKETLSYIVAMRQAVMYLKEPDLLGDLYSLLDTHICWLGTMSQQDAHQFIVEEASRARQTVPDEEIAALLALTGGYTSVLKVACAWWLTVAERPPLNKWQAVLGQLPTVRHRLDDIWHGLTQEEQWLLARLNQTPVAAQAQLSSAVLERLGQRGLCHQTAGQWQMKGVLWADYVQTAVRRGLGRIWQDELTSDLFQGEQRLEGLRPLEEALLLFLVENPYTPHSKTEIIEGVWPDGTQRAGVTDESLYQIVRGLRKKIEPATADEPVYLLTKRGVDEGGYRFFPEGYPAATAQSAS